MDNVQEKYIDEAQARENMSASHSDIFKVLEMWKIKPELTGVTDILEVHGVCKMNCKCRTAGDCRYQIECKCGTELSLETKPRYESEISMIEGAAGKYKTKNPCTYKLPDKLEYKDRPGITEIDRPHTTKVKAELERHLTDHESPRLLDSGILADECQFGFEPNLRGFCECWGLIPKCAYGDKAETREEDQKITSTRTQPMRSTVYTVIER